MAELGFQVSTKTADGTIFVIADATYTGFAQKLAEALDPAGADGSRRVCLVPLRARLCGDRRRVDVRMADRFREPCGGVLCPADRRRAVVAAI